MHASESSLGSFLSLETALLFLTRRENKTVSSTEMLAYVFHSMVI